MKKIRGILLACCLFLCSVFSAGCYHIQAQTMKNLKGTYKMTNWMITNTRFVKDKETGKEVKETTTTDNLAENNKEIYLVITGNDTGYYAYKDDNNAAYIVEVELKYENNQKESDKYDYVSYKFSTNIEFDNDDHYGVAKGNLNHNVTAQCGKIFGLPFSTPGFDKDWKKVSKKTDLTTVQEAFGENTPIYTLEDWMIRGGYKVDFGYDATQLPPEQTFVEPYEYYFVVLDPISDKATTYFLEKKENATAQKKTEEYSVIEQEEGASILKIGNVEWRTAEEGGTNFVREIDSDGINPIPYKMTLRNHYRGKAEEATEYIEDAIELLTTQP